MSVQHQVSDRSKGHCELCGSNEEMTFYTVPSRAGNSPEEIIHVCNTCSEQLNDDSKMDPNHWRCLNDSMWSDVAGVKVVAWRVLNKLKGEGWPVDLLDMMYMEDDVAEWAKEGVTAAEDEVVHKDSNGVQLQAGDTVTIIKDLNVKGTSLVAKRGTAVRNISLVHDHPDQIEGKVEGQKIVILTQFVKK